MGVHITPGFALITVSWRITAATHVQQCTWGISPDAGMDAATMAQQFHNAWLVAWPNSILSNKYTHLATKSQYVPLVGGDPIVGFSASSGIGSSAVASYAPNTALMVRKVTAYGGRSGQGRCYLPAGYVAEADVDEAGAVLPASVTGFQTRCNTLVSDLTTRGILLTLLHEKEGILPRQITQLVVDPKVATQRRRLR